MESQETYTGDLRQYDSEFERTEVKMPGEFERLPDGVYTARIKDFGLVKTKDGRPMVKWTLEVVDQEFFGRLQFKNTVIQNNTMGIIKTDLHVVGMTGTKISELPYKIEEIRDRYIKFALKTKKDNQNVYFQALVTGKTNAANPHGGRVNENGIPF